MTEIDRNDSQEPLDAPPTDHSTTLSEQKLIPVKEFLLTHLPTCYQHVEMYNLIQSLVDITVKIEVDNDEKRKQILSSNNQNPFMTSKLSDINTSSGSDEGQCPKNISDIYSSDVVLGSGKVDDVFIHKDKDGICPCANQCKEWGEIRILTSAQLMYDDDDAKHFVCTFFYDDDEHIDQLKYARGHRIVMRDRKKDVCMLMCVTCDVELIRTLENMLDKFERSWEDAYDKYVDSVKWENERLTVIVSHPYGLKKHISLGKASASKDESSEKGITYDTPTYKGSTGAYVLIPDFDIKDDL